VSEPDLQRALAELENRNVLVFDWGGGTLDLNLCRIAGGVIYQISTRGNNEVGGDRFDDRLRNLIRNAHARQRGIEDLKSLEQPGASTKLLNQCELAKISALFQADPYRGRSGTTSAVRERRAIWESRCLAKNFNQQPRTSNRTCSGIHCQRRNPPARSDDIPTLDVRPVCRGILGTASSTWCTATVS
jgi:hypothetical protein